MLGIITFRLSKFENMNLIFNKTRQRALPNLNKSVGGIKGIFLFDNCPILLRPGAFSILGHYFLGPIDLIKTMTISVMVHDWSNGDEMVAKLS